MTQNPIKSRIDGLHRTISRTAWSANISQPTLTLVLNGKRPLSFQVAVHLERPLNSSALALCMTNAFWRRSQGITLNSSEEALIAAAEAVTGVQREQLSPLVATNLYCLETVLKEAPPAAPGVVLNSGDKQAAGLTTHEDDQTIPKPPAILLQKGGK